MKFLLFIVLSLSMTALAEEPLNITFELQLLHREMPVYPYHAVWKRLEGWVRIVFIINAEGEVENPRVKDWAGYAGFQKAALKAIKKFKFKPREVDGKPVAMLATQTIEFKLNKRRATRPPPKPLADLIIDRLPDYDAHYTVVLADTMRIKSRLQKKNDGEKFLALPEKPFELQRESFSWHDPESGPLQRENEFRIIDWARHQYAGTPGLFRQFLTLPTGANHGPVFYGGVNSLALNAEFSKKVRSLRLRIRVSESGEILNLQADNPMAKDMRIRFPEAWAQIVDQLRFLPARKKGQAVTEQVVIRFDVLPLEATDYIDALVNKYRPRWDLQHWVKVVYLVDEAGLIEKHQALEYSSPEVAEFLQSSGGLQHFMASKIVLDKPRPRIDIEFFPVNPPAQE